MLGFTCWTKARFKSLMRGTESSAQKRASWRDLASLQPEKRVQQTAASLAQFCRDTAAQTPACADISCVGVASRWCLCEAHLISHFSAVPLGCRANAAPQLFPGSLQHLSLCWFPIAGVLMGSQTWWQRALQFDKAQHESITWLSFVSSVLSLSLAYCSMCSWISCV